MALTDRAPELTEARRYAALLEWGTRTGLLLLLLSFAAYVLGWIAPLVPLQQLPLLWGLSATEFHQATAAASSSDDALRLIRHGDTLNMVGIGVLALCSLPPLLALIPLFARQRNGVVFAIICLLETLVLGLAASGILGVGH